MRDEFEGLRRQVHALSASVAQQRAMLMELGGSRVSELNTSLAELEGCAAALRNEASRLQGFEQALGDRLTDTVTTAISGIVSTEMGDVAVKGVEDLLRERLTDIVADAVRPQLRAAIAARLPELVTESVAPAVRSALQELEGSTTDLRQEYGRLQSLRDELTVLLPDLIDTAVRQAVARRMPAAPPPACRRRCAARPRRRSRLRSLHRRPPPPRRLPWGRRGRRRCPAPPAAPQRPGPVAAPPRTCRRASPFRLAAGPGRGAVGADGRPGAPPSRPPRSRRRLPLLSRLPRSLRAAAAPRLAPSLARAACPASCRGWSSGRRWPAGSPTPWAGPASAAAAAVGPPLRQPGSTATTHSPATSPAGSSASPAARERRPPAPPWAPLGLAAVVAGERDGAEVAVDLADTQGLVLHGPGGDGVARAAVIGVLATREPASAVAMVVGDLLPAAPPFPGLVQAPELEMVLEELTSGGRPAGQDAGRGGRARRRRLPGQAARRRPPADPGGGQGRRGRRPGRPAGVVRRRGEGRGLGDRRHGSPDGGPAVAVGSDDVVDAASDGPLAGARLFSVEPDVASELLAVLAAARTDGDHMQPVRDGDDSFVPATSHATAPVAVQLLGAYKIEVEGTEIRSGLRAKAKELLAFYLLHPEGASLDDCIEALWPEADPKRGSEWFWTALGNLRTKLRQATGQKELKIVDRDGDLYRIEDVFDVDLWSLQHALKEGTDTKDDATRLAALDRAVADYAGDLLAGADWFWLETPREDLRQRMVDVLVWLGDRRWATGDARGAWAALQRALEVDPFAEQIYRRVMRLQAKLSRPDDADATFRRLQAKLLEIDLQPTPESDKLYADVCKKT